MEYSKSVDSDSEEEKLLAKSTESEEGSKSKKWKDILLVVVILTAQFVSLCADTVLYPFFPLEAKRKGLTDTQIGLVFSSFELSRFLTSIVVAYLISKVNPKTWCLFGSTMSTICCISFGLASYAPNRIYLPLCIVIRWLAGSGTAALFVAGMSILLKATSFHASTIASLSEMMQGGAFATGPSLGAALYELGGFTCMFWTTGGIMGVLNITQVFLVPKIEEKSVSKNSSLYLLKIPGILVIFMHYFIYKILGSARQTEIGEFITTAFHKPASTIGLLFGVWSICYISACAVMPQLVRRGLIFSCMLFAWIIIIISYIFMGPTPLLDFIFHGQRYFVSTVILICMVQIVEAAVYIPPFQAAINLADVNGHPKDSIQTYGMVAGLINSACALGCMIGPTAAGAITETLSFTWTTTILAFLGAAMLLLLIVYLVIMKITKQPLTPEEAAKQENTEHGDPAYSAKQIADKLESCFTESMKGGTKPAPVQPK